jgi:broad specificity phosphatase PhoE
MAMTRLYFVRHGESEANVQHVFSNRDLPHSLTPLGREQVARLAEQLVGVGFAAFYCSPVLRARQSADIISARLGLEYVVSPALVEYDVGEFEGRSDAASWQRYADVQKAWFEDRDFSVRMAGGESLDDIRARFVPFIDGLLAAPARGPVLLLGHGGTFRCMFPLVMSNVTFDYIADHHMGYTDVVIGEQRGSGLVCIQWGAEAGP